MQFAGGANAAGDVHWSFASLRMTTEKENPGQNGRG